jgi:hypothetical protein
LDLTRLEEGSIHPGIVVKADDDALLALTVQAAETGLDGGFRPAGEARGNSREEGGEDEGEREEWRIAKCQEPIGWFRFRLCRGGLGE